MSGETFVQNAAPGGAGAPKAAYAHSLAPGPGAPLPGPGKKGGGGQPACQRRYAEKDGEACCASCSLRAKLPGECPLAQLYDFTEAYESVFGDLGDRLRMAAEKRTRQSGLVRAALETDGDTGP